MRKELDLSISNLSTVRGKCYEMAMLPWGATEPHNLHLPYLTDCILSQSIAVEAAMKLYAEKGVRCMVLPPVAMGAQNPGQRDVNFCIHYRYETQKAILKDIVEALQHQGIRKLLIVNGHGGNCFKNMIRDLAVDDPDFIIASSEWFKMCNPKEYFDNPGDHADEVETSVMMHYHPELVDLKDAGEGAAKGFRIPALSSGKIWIPRNWSMISTDTGIGNPALATAEKGKKFAEAVVIEYVDFLYQFSLVKSASDLY